MLEDLRGQGPPGDIGTFVSPASVIVYQHTFSGTTYFVAARQGDRGWVLIPNGHGTVFSTVLQSAIALSVPIFIMAGNYLITVTISLASNVFLVGQCESTRLYATANITLIQSIGTGGTHIVNTGISDMWLQGSRAGNGHGLQVDYTDYLRVENCRIQSNGANSAGTTGCGI